MSVTGLSSNPNKPHNNSFHRRNNSGELDVFEATGYFSGANQFSLNITGENGRRAARMSLDLPAISNHEKLQMKDNDKTFKQPSSPGGRLASFLNSLFNQTASKKKKSKSSTKDDREDGRKRRSSISHFRIASPPAKTPTKPSYKEISDHLKVKNEAIADEEFRFSNGNEEEKIFRKLKGGDDGADSDSSSDLFDLPINYGLDLPVYGTTDRDRISIGATLL